MMVQPKLLKNILTLFFFACSSLQLIAQTPCTSGMAGSYPCSNIDLTSHLSLSDLGAGSGQEGNDIWGWTHPTTGKEYALVGLTNGTKFVDISNPASPLVIGFLPAHVGGYDIWRDIKVVNGYAYIGAEKSNSGVQIFELDRLDVTPPNPITFTEDGWINLPGGQDDSHNIVALEARNKIYPVGTGANCGGGITTYDVSNPTSPSWDGCFSSDGYTHDAICFIYRGPDTDHTGKEICIGFNTDTYTIIDMDNENIIKRQTYSTHPNGFYTHQGWVTDDHKYVIFDDELDESNHGVPTTTFVWDISDLDNPSEKYVYESTTNAIDHNQYVRGPYVYQANYRAGLRILDISDLDNNPPVEVAYFDVYPSNDNASFNGAWSVYPYFDSGVVLINGIEQGLFMVEPNLPHNVIEVVGTGVDSICIGEDLVFTLENKAFAGLTSSDNLTISNLPAGVNASFSVNPVPANSSTTLTITATENLAAGNYSFMVSGSQAPTNRISLAMVVANTAPAQPALESPADEAINLPAEINFSWNPASNANFYDLEVALDPLFQNVVYAATDLTTTNASLTIPEPGETFYWHVIARNNCDVSTISTRWIFTISEGALPVELVKLQATPWEQTILLDWQTATEVGNSGFEIERTTNPNANFENIAWVATLNGNGNSLQNYTYTDKNVLPGIEYYYRLKQIDEDGHFTYSPIVSASLERATDVVTAFPNPANDQLFLQLDAAHYFRGTGTLTIHDITGKLLLSQSLELDALLDPYILDINHLAKGTYELTISSEQLNVPLRFVKL